MSSDARVSVIIEAFFAVLIAICVLDAWVTWRVVHDDLSSSSQRVAQITLVWLLPAVGALIVLNMQRRNGERGSGRYREIPDPGDDFGYSRLSFKKGEGAVDND